MRKARECITRSVLLCAGILLAVIASRAYAQVSDDVPAVSDVDAVSDDEFRVSVGGQLRTEIDQLATQLGSPEYKTREAATRRLIDIGVPAFSMLRSAYHRTDELEVRLRIEKIVRTAYLDYHVYNRNGFLGISQQNVPVVHADDPRIREGHIGIKVREVIANTAAQEADFKAEDVIVALDGEPLSSKTASPTTEFGESIRQRGPGTTVTLSILRGPRELEIEAVLRPRPREYYGRYQVTVSRMAEETRERFRIWWSMYFRQASALTPGRGRPLATHRCRRQRAITQLRVPPLATGS